MSGTLETLERDDVVTIVATGAANLASVRAALARFELEAVVTQDPNAINRAARLVLPGVGAFGAAMRTLAYAELVDPLRDRIRDARPTLAICLGMQLLAQSSDESPAAQGLGLWDDHVARFPSGVRVPQFGWNRVTAQSGAELLQDGYAYFANSYRLTRLPSGWSGALADHAGPFVAAAERGAMLTCQFHPELSGAWGERLLQRWLIRSGARLETATC